MDRRKFIVAGASGYALKAFAQEGAGVASASLAPGVTLAEFTVHDGSLYCLLRQGRAFTVQVQNIETTETKVVSLEAGLYKNLTVRSAGSFVLNRTGAGKGTTVVEYDLLGALLRELPSGSANAACQLGDTRLQFTHDWNLEIIDLSSSSSQVQRIPSAVQRTTIGNFSPPYPHVALLRLSPTSAAVLDKATGRLSAFDLRTFFGPVSLIDSAEILSGLQKNQALVQSLVQASRGATPATPLLVNPVTSDLQGNIYLVPNPVDPNRMTVLKIGSDGHTNGRTTISLPVRVGNQFKVPLFMECATQKLFFGYPEGDIVAFSAF